MKTAEAKRTAYLCVSVLLDLAIGEAQLEQLDEFAKLPWEDQLAVFGEIEKIREYLRNRT